MGFRHHGDHEDCDESTDGGKVEEEAADTEDGLQYSRCLQIYYENV